MARSTRATRKPADAQHEAPERDAETAKTPNKLPNNWTPKKPHYIPEGFFMGTVNDEDSVIMPNHFLGHYQHGRGAYRKKLELQAQKQHNGNGISHVEDVSDRITEMALNYPPNPLLSNHERLDQHAEVLALCEQMGISYLDASHRLYIAEIEKYKNELQSLLAFEELEAHIEMTLQLISAHRDEAKEKDT